MKVKVRCLDTLDCDDGAQLICEFVDTGYRFIMYLHNNTQALLAASTFGLMDRVQADIDKTRSCDLDTEWFKGREGELTISEPFSESIN